MNETIRGVAAGCFLIGFATSVLGQGIERINGDDSRDLMGDGTGVVVAVLDSGIDANHPALRGVDSLGNSRLVAEGIFTNESTSPTDQHGHGTQVGGIILSADPNLMGLAPDARYINSRVLTATNGFNTSNWVTNGAGFAVQNGADVMNFSLNTFGEFSNGTLSMDRLIDWAAAERGIVSAVCAGNISQSSGGDPNVRAPAGSFNSIAVGWTSRSDGYNSVHSNSSIGPTSDGRIKPDVVAPGHLITSLNDDWEFGSPYDANISGCSFATPHVSGLLAQQIDYGRANGLETDPLVLKATLLNSAEKDLFDKNGGEWSPYDASTIDDVYTVTSPLDDQLGAGQVDGVALYEQYSAGKQGPGSINEMGWDYGTIGDSETFEYVFEQQLAAGSMLTATLTWFREVDYIDNGDGVINSFDSFNVQGSLDDLDLTLLRDGTPIAISQSRVDNLEHLYFSIPTTGNYSLQVNRFGVVNSGTETDFGFAWSATAIPEPSGMLALAMVSAVLAVRRRTRS